MAYFAVNGVSKRFGGLQALNDCTWDAEKGSITCLVGPNGAGKTTVFNVITGFLPADSGEVSFRGQRLDMLAPKRIVEAGIVRTFQDIRLFGDQTALENILVALKPTDFTEGPVQAIFRPLKRRKVEAELAELAFAYLEDVGLADRAKIVASSLSYGQQKRLSIARALATGAELLLLDEPASGLDADALDNMVSLIMRLKDQGHSLVIVEHNTQIVRLIADKVVFLHQGHVLASGTASEIIRDPKLTSIYFGGGH